MRRLRAAPSQSRFSKRSTARVAGHSATSHIGTVRVAGHSVRGTLAAFLNRDCEGAAPKSSRSQ
jgi:hypothetical protein